MFSEDYSIEKLNKAYEKAWESKKFEIENYWKRATYFWAFQVACFAGYFTLVKGENGYYDPISLYSVIGLGLITSLAWLFSNLGSKTWQRHWENLVDLLEDKITGPLYKISTMDKTFSVSKINEIVSCFFIFIWVGLGIRYWIDNNLINPFDINQIDWYVALITIAVIVCFIVMFFFYGRGKFVKRKIKLYLRKEEYEYPRS